MGMYQVVYAVSVRILTWIRSERVKGERISRESLIGERPLIKSHTSSKNLIFFLHTFYLTINRGFIIATKLGTRRSPPNIFNSMMVARKNPMVA
jgi:hypothetical protein